MHIKKKITYEDLFRGADTIGRLLELFDAKDDAQIAYEINSELLQMNYDFEMEGEDSKYFSDLFKSQMVRLNKIITALTKDQYVILQWLRGQKKASIAGCAGSGKTLIAIEKAIRLDNAGLRTLILCHNPLLAENLRCFVKGTTIEIFDFISWINYIEGEIDKQSHNWSIYYEPTDTELNTVFEKLISYDKKYDAIIVDEGQDFHERWWMVLESALINIDNGILYIFFDDNQSLLPHRSKFLLTESPYYLSKNCRKAGVIFEKVRRFHSHAPEVSILLSNLGVFKKLTFSKHDRNSMITKTILDALKYLSPEQLVVLTNEENSIENSYLNNFEIFELPKWRWQDVVLYYLNLLIKPFTKSCSYTKSIGKTVGLQHAKKKDKKYIVLPPKKIDLPKLSDDHFPTNEDINVVCNFAKEYSAFRDIDKNFLKDAHWLLTGESNLVISPQIIDSPVKIAAFFSSKDWATELPKPKMLCKVVSGNDNCIDSQVFRLQLNSILSFKGLESDGAIVIINSMNEKILTNLYVGLSRARFYLSLLVDNEIYFQIPQLQDL